MKKAELRCKIKTNHIYSSTFKTIGC